MYGYQVLCYRDYEVIRSKDVGCDEWSNIMRTNYQYCKSLPWADAMEFRGKCRDIELPSFHPYWSILVALDKIGDFDRHRTNLQLCLSNPNLLALYYNKEMTLEKLQRIIEDLAERVEPALIFRHLIDPK